MDELVFLGLSLLSADRQLLEDGIDPPKRTALWRKPPGYLMYQFCPICDRYVLGSFEVLLRSAEDGQILEHSLICTDCMTACDYSDRPVGEHWHKLEMYYGLKWEPCEHPDGDRCRRLQEDDQYLVVQQEPVHLLGKLMRFSLLRYPNRKFKADMC